MTCTTNDNSLSERIGVPSCILTGLEEGIFPNENRKSGRFLEEEKAMLCGYYKGYEILVHYIYNARYLHGSYNYLMPSRFISEIPDELLESVKSDNYQHVKSKNVIPLRKKITINMALR